MADGKDGRLERLRERLRNSPGRGVPDGPFTRIGVTAAAVSRTAASVLVGALRGRGGPGLARADLDTVEQLVASLGQLKGVAMKMGQILGYVDERIPPEARKLLSLLQTQSQPAEPQAIAKVLRKELGRDAHELFASFDPFPISVASIGQVHRARPGSRDVGPGAGLDMASVIQDKRALMRLELPGKLLFLFRIRFGLYAVLARLGSVCDWSALEASFADEI